MTRIFVVYRCIVVFCILCCFPQLGLSGEVAAHGANEFYKLSATLSTSNKLALTYNIDPCCYLYKRGFSFQVLGSDVVVSHISLPESLRHNDEFFGDVEIYRGEVLIVLDLDFSRVVVPSDSLSIAAEHQGCADEGICFLPERNVVRFATLPGLL